MAWYDTDWLKRKSATIDHTLVGSTLTDFPVVVPLDEDILTAARPDLRDVLFTSSDEVTKLKHELVKHSFVGLGTWTWFNSPRAVFHNGTYRRTYTGGMHGSNVMAYAIDHDSRTASGVTLTAGLETDDHDNPGILVRASDSKLVYFYAKHAADTTLRYKVSTNAEDISAWGSEQTTTFGHSISYANPIELPDDSNACYVFSRLNSGPYKWSYKRTADYSSWGSQVDFWSPATGQAYVHCMRNGTGRIDFFASDAHPDNDAGIESNLYHFYCAWDSGTSTLKWYSSDGTEQTLPMTPAKATLVFDGTTAEQDGWNHHIDIDGSGYPRVLFQKRVSTTGTGDNRLMFSRWNGGAWTTPVEICALGGYVYSGELSYTGCSCFDGADINKVYVGVEVSGVYEIQQYNTSDNGATWTKVADITSGSDTGAPNLRPFSPKGHDGSCACLWASGSYTSWTVFAQGIYCHPPMRVDAHVKVPSVSSSADTEIWCYYDNQAAADQADPANVWDSNFLAVHHMAPRPGQLGVWDSTSNSADCTRKSIREPTDVDEGQAFDRSNDYLLNSVTGLAGLTGLTSEILFQYTGAGAAGAYHTLQSNWNSSPTKASVLVLAYPTADSNGFRGFVCRQTNTQIGGAFGVSFTVDAVQYAAIAFDSAGSLVGQVNETQGGTTYTAGGAMDATAGDSIRYGDTPHFPGRTLGGTIYEGRLSNVARSTDWRSATSLTLRTPLTFLALGTEETAGGGVVTATTSLSLAIQQAHAIAAGMSVAVQAPASASASASLAVQAARSAQAGLDLAVQQARSAVAGVQAAVQASGASSTGLQAAVQLAGSAVASLDLAVQAQGASTTAVSLQVQAAGTVSTGVDLQVQGGSSATVALSLAVLRQALASAGLQLAVVAPRSAGTGLSAALQAAHSAAATLALAVQATRTAGASVNLQVQGGQQALAAVDVAVQHAEAAATGVQLAIARAASANVSLSAVVMVQRVVSAAASAAVRAARSAGLGVGLYVFDGDAVVLVPGTRRVAMPDVAQLARSVAMPAAGAGRAVAMHPA